MKIINAQSTQVKTPEGKTISCWNAVTHGFFSGNSFFQAKIFPYSILPVSNIMLIYSRWEKWRFFWSNAST
jgi:hypothetical protein